MKKTLLLNIIVLLTAFLFIACDNSSSDDESSPITWDFEDQVLQGKVGGYDWYHRGGYSFNGNNGTIGITLYAEEVVDYPCSLFSYNTNETVSFSFRENSRGVTILDNSGATLQTVTLYDGSANRIATVGAYRIDSVTDDEITGSIDAQFNDENNVNGYFTVDRCD